MGLPWHVALVPDRRALLTVGGISLAVAFTVLSFSIGAALEGSTIELGAHLQRGDVAIRRDLLAPFDPADLALEGPLVAVLLVDATTPSGERLTLAAIEGNASIVAPGTFRVRAGYDRFPATLEIIEPARSVFRKDDATSDAVPMHAWPRIAPEDARQLDPALSGGRVSFVVARTLSPEDAARLATEGYHVDPAPAADRFFSVSSREVARSLILVVVVSSILAGLFTYEFFRSEVREKRRQIALWRAIGMRGRDVLLLLLARALALGAAGTAIGALAAIGALGVAATMTSIDLLSPQLGIAATLGLVACFLLAALAGSLPPAIGAARATIAPAMEDST